MKSIPTTAQVTKAVKMFSNSICVVLEKLQSPITFEVLGLNAQNRKKTKKKKKELEEEKE